MSPTASGLKQEWEELKTRNEHGAVDYDEQRATLLARYHGQGMPQREIGKTVEIGGAYVNHLLRYHRFTLFATANKVPERKFRAFWYQVRDPQKTRDTRRIDPAYEQECFEAIRELIEKDKPPPKARRKKKQPKPEDIKNARDVAKQVRRTYERLRPDLEKLRSLLGQDRATYAPDVQAGIAQTIDREFQKLLDLLNAVEQGEELPQGD